MATNRPLNRFRGSALAGLTVVALLIAAGCAGIRTESDGRQVGTGICDLKEATSQNQAERYLRKIDRNLQQAQRKTGLPVSQDINQIDRQLDDLSKHATNGSSTLAQQDVAVLQRNVSQAIQTTTGNAQRFYQGLQQGLSNCDGS